MVRLENRMFENFVSPIHTSIFSPLRHLNLPQKALNQLPPVPPSCAAVLNVCQCCFSVSMLIKTLEMKNTTVKILRKTSVFSSVGTRFVIKKL